MRQLYKKLFIRIMSLLLALVFIVPVGVNAAVPETVAPRASDYLMSYTSYICHMGSGELQIWFRVTGITRCADIGALTIYLYESQDQTNWTLVETFMHADYPDMLDHDSGHHMSYVTYQGKLARYYRAYVCIWAGDEDCNGDTRYIWTEVEFASPFT